jgi:uncharacterized membrane protein (UPF0127 family)
MKCFLAAALFPLAIAHAQETAQPALPTITLSIGDKSLTAEVADEPVEEMTGLMFRKELAPDSGMLFVMDRPQRASFWMKNTLLPLSVAYINQTGTILEIHDLQPHDEKPVPSAFANIAYALEMEQGWFTKKGVLAGDHIQGLPRAP